MIFKCKICGGSLDIKQGEKITECEYCGVKQTMPSFIDSKTQEIYERANSYLMHNEFDKAENLYNQILFDNKEDADAYWNVLMCRYGVTYVKDPANGKYIPTCNRTLYAPIFNDENYQNALKYADEQQKELYRQNAKTIDDIQKGILAVSEKEEPFDVFICYKETDEQGRRTQDSVIAYELYHQLTQEGFKVFFSRITLEDKLGQEYEPYIFAALNSAKAMVVIGTNPEYFNAVWVKNEWSRFLTLIKNGADKILIPAYRDMNPYDLPQEFANLQAQDMSKLGFMQDLIRGIRKIVSSNADEKSSTATIGVANIDSILKRAFMSLSDEEFKRADSFAEQVLNIDSENAQAYLVKLLVSLKVKNKDALKDCKISFENNTNYKKLLSFADNKLKSDLQGYLTSVSENRELKNKENKKIIKKVATIGIPIITVLITLIVVLVTVIMPMQKYNKAEKYIEEGRMEESKQLFMELGNYKDSQKKLENFIVVPKKITTTSPYGTTITSEFIYDSKGNMISYSDNEWGLFETYKYIYDEKGNLIRRECDIGSKSEYTYDENGNVTKIVYNGEDGLISTTEYIYDENGDCIKHIIDDPYEGSSVIEYTYDENGNCIKEGDTEITYNSKNQCIKSVTRIGDIYYTNEYMYDESGNLTKSISYDNRFDSSSKGKYTYTYEYNEKGQVIMMENYDGDTFIANSRYMYDEYGNITKVSRNETSYGGFRYNKGNEYIYDEYGNCIEKIDVDSSGERTSTKKDYEYQLIYVSTENVSDSNDITDSYREHMNSHSSVYSVCEAEGRNPIAKFNKLSEAINYINQHESIIYKVYFTFPEEDHHVYSSTQNNSIGKE